MIRTREDNIVIKDKHKLVTLKWQVKGFIEKNEQKSKFQSWWHEIVIQLFIVNYMLNKWGGGVWL